jgi:hypothetical protein
VYGSSFTIIKYADYGVFTSSKTNSCSASARKRLAIRISGAAKRHSWNVKKLASRPPLHAFVRCLFCNRILSAVDYGPTGLIIVRDPSMTIPSLISSVYRISAAPNNALETIKLSQNYSCNFSLNSEDFSSVSISISPTLYLL